MRRETKSRPRARARARKAGAGGEPLRQARIAAIADVAAVLGHESQNLLGALDTCVQLLRKNPNLAPDDAALLDIVQSGARRLGEIVAEFSGLRHAKSLRRAPIDLHELIESAASTLRADERCAPSITVSRRFAPSIDSLSADREQLGLAIWHLLLNAAQAMGDRGALEIATRRRRRAVEIEIRDSGPGIPPAAMNKIFAPLYTTKPRGVGLGLTIARAIVEAHGGRIAARSGRGAGATFTVVLPSGAAGRRRGG